MLHHIERGIKYQSSNFGLTLISVGAYMSACVYVCVHVFACQNSHVVWGINLLIKGCGFDSHCGHFAISVVSLSKKLYLHCSSLPSCINLDLVLARKCVCACVCACVHLLCLLYVLCIQYTHVHVVDDMSYSLFAVL